METTSLDRRQFCFHASAWTLLLAAHAQVGAFAEDAAPSAVGEGAVGRIASLRLLTAAPLGELRGFYHGLLGLPVLAERPDELTIGAGTTQLTFVPAGPEHGRPFYHVAFNVPENKLLLAREWQLERTPLLPPNNGNAPAPGWPPEVTDFRHWNAHSLFFWDPAGNLLEYIARHDLKNAAPGGFSTADILYASEIGFISDEVPATARELQAATGLGQYRQGGDQFRAIGDETGLLLVIGKGRNWWGHPADIFPTQAGIRGQTPGHHTFTRLPHHLTIS